VACEPSDPVDGLRDVLSELPDVLSELPDVLSELPDSSPWSPVWVPC